MGRRSYLKVRCPKCGEIGSLTYRRRLGFYVNHGRATSHRIPRDAALEVVGREDHISLIKYPGGDHFLLPYLLRMIPPHICYVEVFGGSAQLLLNKPPSKVEVYNDIDGDLVNLFRVVKERPREFLEKLDLLPYSRELLFEFRRKLSSMADPVERAAAYFYVNRASFYGVGRGLATSKTSNEAREFFNAVRLVREVHRRLRTVVVENLDFREVIKRYDSKTTFFYCDPPHLYVSTEKHGDYYRAGFTEEDYADLLNLLQRVQGRFLLKQTAVTRVLDNWVRENGFSVRELVLKKSMQKVSAEGGGVREHWRVYFVANYGL